jgi:hypothetical protein
VKIPKGEERPRQKRIVLYIAYVRRQDAAEYAGEKRLLNFFLAVMNTTD